MKSFDSTWEEIHSTQDWGQYPAEHVIRFVARNYYGDDRANTRILDFCCGGGATTWYLAREGFDVYAFDGSPSAVEKVRARLQREGLKAKLAIYDAAETEYDDAFFDAVIDNVSIYANTYANIQIMYGAIYKMLKQGGRILTTVFTDGTTGAHSGRKMEENTFRDLKEGSFAGRGIVHFFDSESIKDLLKKTGFKDIIIDPYTYEDRGQTVAMLIVQAEK